MIIQHVLMRGNLKTRESEIVDGPRDESFLEEANELNQKPKVWLCSKPESKYVSQKLN